MVAKNLRLPSELLIEVGRIADTLGLNVSQVARLAIKHGLDALEKAQSKDGTLLRLLAR